MRSGAQRLKDFRGTWGLLKTRGPFVGSLLGSARLWELKAREFSSRCGFPKNGGTFFAHSGPRGPMYGNLHFSKINVMEFQSLGSVVPQQFFSFRLLKVRLGNQTFPRPRHKQDQIPCLTLHLRNRQHCSG